MCDLVRLQAAQLEMLREITLWSEDGQVPVPNNLPQVQLLHLSTGVQRPVHPPRWPPDLRLPWKGKLLPAFSLIIQSGWSQSFISLWQHFDPFPNDMHPQGISIWRIGMSMQVSSICHLGRNGTRRHGTGLNETGRMLPAIRLTGRCCPAD